MHESHATGQVSCAALGRWPGREAGQARGWLHAAGLGGWLPSATLLRLIRPLPCLPSTQRLRLHALFADARRRILNHRFTPTSAYWRLCARPSSADAAARWAAASAREATRLRREDEEAAAAVEEYFGGEGATSATETEDGPWDDEDAGDATEAAERRQERPQPDEDDDDDEQPLHEEQEQADDGAEHEPQRPLRPLHRGADGASEAAAVEDAAVADE